jgi:Zn-dependent alcohol dehydrogenase
MLDGKNVGTTRMDGYAFNVNNVPAGSHTVTVELAGYPQYTSTVTVIKNQVVKVNADFISGTPTLTGIAVTTTGTPVTTTDRPAPVPHSPLTAIAAAGLIGLAAVFRRS